MNHRIPSLAAAPKGTKSCRTQGDFRLSVCPSFHPPHPNWSSKPQILTLKPGFWAAAPKGTKSCRTQGDFRLSVRPFVPSSVSPPLHQTSQASNPASQNSNPATQASNLASPPSIQPSDLKSALRPQICPLRPQTGWTNGRTNKRKSPCVLQDFVPFGAAALLPLIPINNHAKQGNGYR